VAAAVGAMAGDGGWYRGNSSNSYADAQAFCARGIVTHPYEDLEATPLWSAVDRVLGDLEQNQDLRITTARQYVVGAVCRALAVSKFVSDRAVQRGTALTSACTCRALG